MSMLGVFVLTSAIGISASREPASDARDAYKALAKATYIYSDTDKRVKEIERKYVPKYIKEYGGIVTGVTKVVVEKKVSFEWSF